MAAWPRIAIRARSAAEYASSVTLPPWARRAGDATAQAITAAGRAALARAHRAKHAGLQNARRAADSAKANAELTAHAAAGAVRHTVAQSGTQAMSKVQFFLIEGLQRVSQYVSDLTSKTFYKQIRSNVSPDPTMTEKLKNAEREESDSKKK